MGDENTGTNLDPKWRSTDLTGGNDSGTSGIDTIRLDEAQGEDLTAKLIRRDHMSAGQTTGPDPSMRPPDEVAITNDASSFSVEKVGGSGFGPEASAGTDDSRGPAGTTTGRKTGMIIDPLCGMHMDPEMAPASCTYNEHTFYFCCDEHQQEFEKNPEHYIQRAQEMNPGYDDAMRRAA